MDSIAQNIKMFREIKNVNRKELASYLGISEQALGKYEDGTTEPSINTLKRIAEKLDVDFRAFFDANPQQIFNFYNSQYSGHIVNQHISSNEQLLEKILQLLEILLKKTT
jgi:transcriptional regulator with XRE-family HTH domain